MAVRAVEVSILTAEPTVTGWKNPPTGQIATELVVFFATRTRPLIIEAHVDPSQYETQF